MNELMIEALRKEMAMIIRLMEDSVIVDAKESIYMYVGKLSEIQKFIDTLDNSEKEWVNNDDY